MAPDFGPFFRRLRNILQSFAERVGGGLVVFLVEERFAHAEIGERAPGLDAERFLVLDRKSTRLNSSHVEISYAVFCLKKKRGPYSPRLPGIRLPRSIHSTSAPTSLTAR